MTPTWIWITTCIWPLLWEDSPAEKTISAPEVGNSSLLKISPMEPVTVEISADKGEYLELDVQQMGVDVVLSLFDDSKNLMVKSDLLPCVTGTERLMFIAPKRGTYRLEVKRHSLPETLGEVELFFRVRRKATTRDKAMTQAFFLTAGSLEENSSKIIENLEKAAFIWNGLKEHTWRSFCLWFLGQTFGSQKPQAAMDSLEQALASLQGESKPHPLRALIYRELAYCRRITGNILEADEAYDKALTESLLLQDPQLMAVAYRNASVFMYLTGRLDAAITYSDHAIEFFQQISDYDNEIQCRVNKSIYLNYLAKGELAHDELTEALNLAQKFDNLLTEAKIWSQLGWTRYILDEPGKALSYLERAVVLASALNSDFWLSRFHQRIGSVYQKIEDYDLAAFHHCLALTIAENLPDQQGFMGHAWNNLSQIHLARGDDEQARNFGLLALDRFRALGITQGRELLLSNLSTLAQREGRQDLALELMTQAVDLLEETRKHTKTRQLGRSFAATRAAYYEKLISLLMERHWSDPTDGFHQSAFLWAEKNRNRSLAALYLSQSGSEDWVFRERRLREQINNLAKADPNQEANLRELSRLLLAQDRLWAEVAGWPSDTPDPKTLAKLLLDQQSCLITYSLGESESYLWLLNPKGLHVYPLPGREIIEEKVSTFLALIEKNQSRYRGSVRLLASDLGKILLGPVEDEIIGKNLLISLTETLHNLPFGCLTLKEPENYRPIFKDIRISRIPSANFGLFHLEQASSQAAIPNEIALFADPVFEESDPRFPETSEYSRLKNRTRSTSDSPITWKRLPFSAKEAEIIISLTNSNTRLVHTGFKASKKSLEMLELDAYRYLHFATHGFSHPTHEELSGLALAQWNTKGYPIDGMLRAHEILSMNVRSELVVLSACRAEKYAFLQGEGPWGLAQAFLGSGARAVLSSLWNVNDLAGSFFFERFYTYLLKYGETPIEAWRLAQGDMLDDPRFANLFYWAGFVFHGYGKEKEAFSQALD